MKRKNDQDQRVLDLKFILRNFKRTRFREESKLVNLVDTIYYYNESLKFELKLKVNFKYQKISNNVHHFFFKKIY